MGGGRARGRLVGALAGLTVLVAVVVHSTLTSSGQDRDTAPGSGRVPPGPGRLVVGAQFHGLWAEWREGERERVLDVLVANGVRHVRIDVSWAMIQPHAHGRYDMTWGVPFVDRVMSMVEERGMSAVATFWLTPGWAAPPHGARSLPEDVGDYAAALRWAAARWRGTVEAREIWNEPNSDRFLVPPDPVRYGELLPVARRAVEAGDPTAQVVFAGTEYVDVDWVRRALDAGATGHFDVMAVHPYSSPSDLDPASDGTGGHHLTDLSRLVDLLASERGDAPIWVTEIGWSVHANLAGAPAYSRGVSEQTQAAYLTSMLDVLERGFPRVQRVFWYTAADTSTGRAHQDHFGLVRHDGTVRPALARITCYQRGDC